MSGYDACYEQLALFTPHPSQISTPEYDPYWDEITKNFAHEHSDNNSSSVASETAHLLDTCVREQTIQGVEVAHEHIDTNNKEVAITTTSLLDTGVREQTIQRLEVAHEHIEVSSEEVAITTTSLLDTGVREQLSNPVNGCNGYKKPEQEKITHWVEPYWVNRRNKKHWYYRYAWMSGRKQHRTHIGSTSSEVAIAKRAVVLQMIADDAMPEEIISYLK